MILAVYNKGTYKTWHMPDDEDLKELKEWASANGVYYATSKTTPEK